MNFLSNQSEPDAGDSAAGIHRLRSGPAKRTMAEARIQPSDTTPLAKPYARALRRVRFAVPIIAMVCGAVASAAIEEGQARRPVLPERGEQEAQIKVEVNLVSVLASVTDSNGRPIPDLPREAFEVYEEGVKQKLELFEPETSQPLDLVLMLDTSLSTLKELAFIKEAAAHFVRQIVRPGDRMAVFELETTVTQMTAFVSDVRALREAVRAVAPGAGTSLYDAIYLGSEALLKRPFGRRRVIVMITDAGESTSTLSFEEARRWALRSEALLYTILVRPVRNESGRNTAGEHALITITDVTGGVMYRPDSSEELGEIFDRIDRELRTQYRLGYYPEPRPRPRSQRRIEVRVAPPPNAAAGDRAVVVKLPEGFVVRHRKGYLTGPFE